MSKILVIGSSNTDMVVKARKFPRPGETVLGGEFFMFGGGKGANQAVAAARMGGDVSFICKVGSDVFGRQTLEDLRGEGIDTSQIEIDQLHPSGVAAITVDEDGENTIVVAPGANNFLDEASVKLAKDLIEKAEIILMQLEIPLVTVTAAAMLGFSAGKKVILNPAPAQALPAELLSCLYLITPNETEAEILTGVKVHDHKTAAEAAGRLISRGVQNVIITMGAEGAYYKNQAGETAVKSPQVKAVDSTAAGDVFNGVLAVELASGRDWGKAIATACRAAALSVTRMGAQASMPHRSEVEAFI